MIISVQGLIDAWPMASNSCWGTPFPSSSRGNPRPSSSCGAPCPSSYSCWDYVSPFQAVSLLMRRHPGVTTPRVCVRCTSATGGDESPSVLCTVPSGCTMPSGQTIHSWWTAPSQNHDPSIEQVISCYLLVVTLSSTNCDWFVRGIAQDIAKRSDEL